MSLLRFGPYALIVTLVALAGRQFVDTSREVAVRDLLRDVAQYSTDNFSRDEQNAMWALASSPAATRVLFVKVALSSDADAKKLGARARIAMHAAAGVDPAVRDRIVAFLRQRLQHSTDGSNSTKAAALALACVDAVDYDTLMHVASARQDRLVRDWLLRWVEKTWTDQLFAVDGEKRADALAAAAGESPLPGMEDAPPEVANQLHRASPDMWVMDRVWPHCSRRYLANVVRQLPQKDIGAFTSEVPYLDRLKLDDELRGAIQKELMRRSPPDPAYAPILNALCKENGVECSTPANETLKPARLTIAQALASHDLSVLLTIDVRNPSVSDSRKHIIDEILRLSKKTADLQTLNSAFAMIQKLGGDPKALLAQIEPLVTKALVKDGFSFSDGIVTATTTILPLLPVERQQKLIETVKEAFLRSDSSSDAAAYATILIAAGHAADTTSPAAIKHITPMLADEKSLSEMVTPYISRIEQRDALAIARKLIERDSPLAAEFRKTRSVGTEIGRIAQEMLDNAWQSKLAANAAAVVLAAPDVKAQDFVDVLKKPSCHDDCIDRVLRLAESTLHVKNDGRLWKFAQWAADQGLDVTSPPRRLKSPLERRQSSEEPD